jgi:thiol peroxidase
MTNERLGGVTLKGNPLTVIGDPISVGDKAPDFSLVANDLTRVTLADSAGKSRLISVVPSLDTGICDAQTRRFNEEAAGFGDNVVILTVSAEHPFNQKRWCGAAGIENVQVVSDHMDMRFGEAYGLYVKELRLDQRAIFVIDKDDVVTYTEYVPEIAQFPDFDSALAALKATAA